MYIANSYVFLFSEGEVITKLWVLSSRNGFSSFSLSFSSEEKDLWIVSSVN